MRIWKPPSITSCSVASSRKRSGTRKRRKRKTQRKSRKPPTPAKKIDNPAKKRYIQRQLTTGEPIDHCLSDSGAGLPAKAGSRPAAFRPATKCPDDGLPGNGSILHLVPGTTRSTPPLQQAQ